MGIESKKSYFSPLLLMSKIQMSHKTLKLRAPEPSDASLLYQWENDISIWISSDTIAPVSLFQIEQLILSSSDIYTNRQQRFMIDCISNNGALTVGTVDLFDFDPRHLRAAVGIMTDKAHRHQGNASMALEELSNYAFGILGLKQLYCYINSNNTISIHLFEKCGYQQTGVRKAWIKEKHGWIDQFHYQLIP
jgi:diamine N-acetyltransferase